MEIRADIEKLVACGHRLAHVLQVPSPTDAELRTTIQEALLDRDIDACVEQGVITRIEGRNALLAHLQTFICDKAGQAEPSELWQDDDLLRAVELAWFGEAC